MKESDLFLWLVTVNSSTWHPNALDEELFQEDMALNKAPNVAEEWWEPEEERERLHVEIDHFKAVFY